MELKDVLQTLGLEGAKDLDAFKEKFQSKFITKDEAYNDEEIKGKITGKVTGAATTLFKRLFELDSSEVQGKKWEEIAELGVSKLKSSIKDLEGKQGQSNEEAIKDLQSKLEKANRSILDFKEQNDTLKTGLETKEKEWSGKYTGLKKSQVMNDALSKVLPKLIKMDSIQQKGFNSVISESIKLDFDEKEELLVLGADGKRIANPNKIGSFLSLEEALEFVASKENLIAKNNGGNQNPNPSQLFTQPKTDSNSNQQQPPATQRRLHPNALTNLERLKAASGQ